MSDGTRETRRLLPLLASVLGGPRLPDPPPEGPYEPSRLTPAQREHLDARALEKAKTKRMRKAQRLASQRLLTASGRVRSLADLQVRQEDLDREHLERKAGA